MPTNDNNCSCHIKAIAYLTNHMRCIRISHHIMTLAINSFRGRHTHTHRHSHTYRHPHIYNIKKPRVRRPRPRAWFKSLLGFNFNLERESTLCLCIHIRMHVGTYPSLKCKFTPIYMCICTQILTKHS